MNSCFGTHKRENSKKRVFRKSKNKNKKKIERKEENELGTKKKRDRERFTKEEK